MNLVFRTYYWQNAKILLIELDFMQVMICVWTLFSELTIDKMQIMVINAAGILCKTSDDKQSAGRYWKVTEDAKRRLAGVK